MRDLGTCKGGFKTGKKLRAEPLLDNILLFAAHIPIFISSVTLLAFVLAAKRFNKRKEVEVYPFLSFVSEFGGALGLFVGFSFMMLWDLIEMSSKCLLSKLQ